MLKKYLEVKYDVFSPGIIVIVVGIKIIAINMTPKIMEKKESIMIFFFY
jgi:hypothetical protein